MEELPDIPDKLYFRIGEVSTLTGVKPSVLRYWESEFRTLRPTKSRTNQRLYTRADVEKVIKLKTLLYEKKFTIAGARRVLAKGYTQELNRLESETGAEAADGGNGTGQGAPENAAQKAGPELQKRVASLISEVQSIKKLLS
ncbi:MAG: MerR family transcriptional regulator [Chrysiogenetes bacterium]|nr:MerR family transcriptional regulator [Chrysiogenetes bacterium]